jgi:hypothetical protein
VSNGLGLVIEGLVAILLVLTIGYSVLLNRRLKRLKSDELALKATISELITATEIAERAIVGLKITVRDCDQGLGEKLRTAERLSADIGRQIEAGEDVCQRLAQIVTAARPGAAAPIVAPDAQATVKAAQAFAARARSRSRGVAA